MTPEAALAELSTFLRDFKPSVVPTYPTHKDARALIGDLEVFAKKVDAVVSAYGEEARSAFNLIPQDVAVFQDTLTNALEGFGFYILDTAGRKADEDAREFSVLLPEWTKARRLGVD